jgi:hypothetical protein
VRYMRAKEVKSAEGGAALDGRALLVLLKHCQYLVLTSLYVCVYMCLCVCRLYCGEAAAAAATAAVRRGRTNLVVGANTSASTCCLHQKKSQRARLCQLFLEERRNPFAGRGIGSSSCDGGWNSMLSVWQRLSVQVAKLVDEAQVQEAALGIGGS